MRRIGCLTAFVLFSAMGTLVHGAYSSVTTGIYHSCVIADDSVFCWGDNLFGQSDIPSLKNPAQVSAGGTHTCALDENGVSCWGDPLYERLNVPTLTNPTQVSAGYLHSCALADSGVVCWGVGADGQTDVPALNNPTQVSAALGWHTCALDDTGVVCWGNTELNNDFGQSDVPELVNPRSVTAGRTHTCALDDTGVVCWGAEAGGDFGQADVPDLSNPSIVSAGSAHTCAVDDTGVVCWGNNDSGQTDAPLLENPTEIDAGDGHTCALGDTGVVCWGDNFWGQTDTSSLDSDGDGIGEFDDNCRTTANPTQIDTDGDGAGDACDNDDDNDGVVDAADECPLDATGVADADGDGTCDVSDNDDDNDGVEDEVDEFPLDASEQTDSDSDGVGDNADAFPQDPAETLDTDADGFGNNADTDDDGDGFSDEEEVVEGSNPLDRYSCPGCFHFDVDRDGKTTALTDGLLVLRHLFGFEGETLIAGAVASTATRSDASAIESYLEYSAEQLDIDGDGTTQALTDGLLLLRYFFGFEGSTLISGAVADEGIRVAAEDIQSYIEAKLPGDTDRDGVGDSQDAFPFDSDESVDTDGDGTGDNADTDDDNDGVLDVTDAFPLDASETADSDGDGIGDNADAFTAGVFEPYTNFNQMCANPRTGADPFTGQQYVDAQGTYVDENQFLRSFSNEFYLWYDEIEDVDPRSMASVLQYFSLMKTFETTASGTDRDKYHFTYDTDFWNEYTQTGAVGVGYGAQFEFLSGTPPREVVVSYTEPNSPATAADVNLSRGTRILEVDGVNVQYGDDVDTLNAGTFPSTEGETHEFTVRDLGETFSRTVTMSATEITVDPVQHVSVISTNSGPVGYLLFNTHGVQAAEKELVDAITYLAAEEVTDLVLDLRYNGGGYLMIANQLAYMIAGPAATQGKVFEETRFNDKHRVYNPFTGAVLSPVLFREETVGFSMEAGQALPSLNLSRVYVLTSSQTCSASEAVMNSLRGIDIEVIQVGGTTCGKPYGFYPVDNCGTTYFTIEFKGVNAKGFGEYTDGFSPSNTPGSIETPIPGCAVADDFDHGFADPDEARLSAALGYRLNGLCPSPTAITSPLLKEKSKKTVKGEWREPPDRHRFPGRIVVPLEAIGR